MNEKRVPPEALKTLGITEEELLKLGITSYDYGALRTLADDPAPTSAPRHLRPRLLERARRQHLARILNACVDRVRHLDEVNKHLRKDLAILTVAVNAWVMNAETQLEQAEIQVPVPWAQLVANTSAAFELVKEEIGEEGMEAMRQAGEEALLGKEKS